jgi:hypothetical protein
MKNFLSKGKKKELGIPTPDGIGMPPTLDGASASSSNISTPNQVKEPKRGPGRWIREHFGSDKSASKKQLPEILTENDGYAQPQVTTDDTEPPQTDSLLINRFKIDRDEDANDQKKLDALDISIQVLDAFKKLTDIIGLVLPDALSLALEYITAILEKLKVRCCPKMRLFTDYLDHFV